MAADGEMLWYDLETTSPDPATCRITQFAAVRTTGGLDTISTASVTVRPDDWVLPTPEAVLVTGLTPEILARDGMPEYEGVLRIREALSAPGATRIGYNSVRFDDEVVRHTLYRGLHDPYELEWRGGAARYDLLDIVRAASVFEPSGVSWGRNGDGALSYSLGATAEANGIGFGGKQHDALADVAATVDLAKVFRDGAPRTWGHAMLCRDKRFVGRVVGTGPSRLLFHSSRLHGNERRCGALVVPVCAHPSIPNRVIGVDVGRDDDALHGMSGGELRDALFAKDGDRAAGSPRPPLVLLETNKPMFVAEIKKGGDPPWAARIGADIGAARARQKRIRDAGAPLADKLKTVYSNKLDDDGRDPELDMYGSFIPDRDRAAARELHGRIRKRDWRGAREVRFGDHRWRALAERLLADLDPNAPAEERERWDDVRRQRLAEGFGKRPSLAEFTREVAGLAVRAGAGGTLGRDNRPASDRDVQILKSLGRHAERMASRLAAERPNGRAAGAGRTD